MRMEPDRVVAIRILTCIEQQAYYAGVPELGCKCKCTVPLCCICGGQQTLCVGHHAQCRSDHETHSSAAPKQSLHRLEFTVGDSGWHRLIRISAVIAKQID